MRRGLVLCDVGVHASPVFAQDADSPSNDAGRHFRRGVDLYGEADYAGALVEFKRAYALAPSASALFNVGEAQYQLQDYAGALKTFRRFLAEFGPGEGHRSEVERNIDVLRTRVGHVAITTTPAGADVSIDDQPAGKTPLGESVLVSVGRRKIVASMPGRAPVTRTIEVAAGDELEVSLPFAATSELGPAPSATPADGSPPATAPAPASHPFDASRLRTGGLGRHGCVGGGRRDLRRPRRDRSARAEERAWRVSRVGLHAESRLQSYDDVLGARRLARRCCDRRRRPVALLDVVVDGLGEPRSGERADDEPRVRACVRPPRRDLLITSLNHGRLSTDSKERFARLLPAGLGRARAPRVRGMFVPPRSKRDAMPDRQRLQ